MRGFLKPPIENMVFTPYNKEEGNMPTISVFYGIRIVMHLKGKEHLPPHIHAIYGNKQASFTISDGELLNGNIPIRARNMVKEFILNNKEELQKMWDDSIYVKLPGLE